jgi:thiamine pyrophosphate-dependent acetolactate synthase large subunit-like protein
MMDHRRVMPLVPALEVIRDLRRDQIVISSMGTAREWPRLSRHPLDFHYVPSAMGQAPILGLGLALAQPRRSVIVLCGDGSLLMNLGCLVTIAASGATNLTLILFDNGVYEVTGGQKTAASAGTDLVDWIAIAKGAGMESAVSFDALEQWRREAAAALALPGPRLIALQVAPVGPDYQLESPGPLAERLAAFQEALLE